MTEATGPVEREARQLVEAAARWLSAVPDQQDDSRSSADRSADPAPGSGEKGEVDVGEATEGSQGTADGDAGEHLCRGCPWCRAKAAAGPIGADTLDSLAQLLGAAAESLSLFAQSRREAAGRADGTAGEGAPGGSDDHADPADHPPATEQDR